MTKIVVGEAEEWEMQDPMERVELTAAVQGLRDQLIASVDASDGQRIKFEVEEVNLEFTVELRRDVNSKAGFRAWVVSGDVQAGATRSSVHRVSVKLKPKDSIDGRPVEVGSTREVDISDFGTPPAGGNSR
ncbi:trypco2 family protein [Streptomyces sp. ISL-12]|uniref:trypco2 family protein n=1 Tax=Streptomyces sp. ISL-12 TaxID=2819177 RepID=UPI0020353139|nr:trypco2 family protein [Streptomyces sp. ISL-12]